MSETDSIYSDEDMNDFQDVEDDMREDEEDDGSDNERE
jgi:hypothetical protein